MNIKTTSILVVLLLLPAISLLLPGCDEGRRVFDIVGQETLAEEEGKYSDVLIRIRYHCNRVSFNQGVVFQVTAPLFATSPAPPVFRHPVSEIKISADADFDSTHPAGSDLRDVFDVFENRHDDMPTLGPPLIPGEDFSLYLKVKQAPTNDLSAGLTITSTLMNGASVTSELASITISK